jgi:hypothetical protein
VNELGELGYSLDKVRVDEVSNPLRWFLANLGGELDLKNTIGEKLLLLVIDLLEWVIDSEIGTSPVPVRSVVAVKVVFTDHGEFGIERYTHTGVTGKLERCSVVECPHDWISARNYR